MEPVDTSDPSSEAQSAKPPFGHQPHETHQSHETVSTDSAGTRRTGAQSAVAQNPAHGGLPSEHVGADHDPLEASEVVVPKTWRSEFQGLLGFFILLVAAIWLSLEFPGTVIRGRLFDIGEQRVFLYLPLLWLIPAWWLTTLLYRIYNVRFVIHERGLTSTIGILAFSQQIRQVRYEDIRSIELDQSLIERFLNVGDLQIGTAGTSDVEMVFEGVSHPFLLKEMVQVRRETREAIPVADTDPELAAVPHTR